MGETADKMGLFAIFSGWLRIWDSSSQTRRNTKLRYTQITLILYMIWIGKSRGKIPDAAGASGAVNLGWAGWTGSAPPG